MSRHGRRGTQGDQDDQWGEYQPPDTDEPFAPGDYGQARTDWSRNPIATADTGDFPVTDSSLPPVSYPRDPGGRGEAFDWGPDPLGLDTRRPDPRGYDAEPYDAPVRDTRGHDTRGHGGYDARGLDPLAGGRSGGPPSPEPMAPDRWAPQSWEAQSWETPSWEAQSRDRASWDSATAAPTGWLNPPGADPGWPAHGDPLGDQPGAPRGGLDDLQAGELPPLPPGPLPGSGHPSGPLPPLPEPDYQWGNAPDPLPPAGRRSGRDLDQSRRPSRHAGPPAGTGPVPGGYPGGEVGYPGDGAGYDHAGHDSAGYPGHPAAYRPDRDEPADYPAPRGRGGRRRGAAAEVGRGHPGYEGYVDDPRDLDMAPDQGQDPGDHAPSGGWYPGDGEPHAWADGGDGGLLPGLDQSQAAPRGGKGGGSAGRARKGRRRVRTILLVLLAVFVVFVAAVGGVGYHYYREYIDPPDFAGPGTGSVVVQILPGQTAETIGATLASKDVVASARAFYNAAKDNPQGSALEPGYYSVHRHMKASLALALLLKPSARVQTKITIPEGFRVAQIIALLGKQTGNLQGYQQAIEHPADLGLPSFANGKPEGYLFPATYLIQPKTSPAAVLQGMVAKFKQNAQSIGLPAAAAKAQESEAGIITVASLIEAEGKRPQDLAKIAEVIYNRLNMTPQVKLELDTTVLYAMSLAHKNGFSINFPSPYNTYLHAGLPPGPIDNPGNAAIQAALHPAHGNLLFFLTINSATGDTLFFSTAAAFNAAVAKYGSRGGGTGSRTGSG